MFFAGYEYVTVTFPKLTPPFKLNYICKLICEIWEREREREREKWRWVKVPHEWVQRKFFGVQSLANIISRSVVLWLVNRHNVVSVCLSVSRPSTRVSYLSSLSIYRFCLNWLTKCCLVVTVSDMSPNCVSSSTSFRCVLGIYVQIPPTQTTFIQPRDLRGIWGSHRSIYED